MTASGSPSASILPKSRTTTRSARLITAFITCSTQMMVIPSVSRAVRTIWREADSSTSLSPAVTSSMSRSRGRPASAFAISRNRCWWRLRLATGWSPRPSRPTKASASCARRIASASPTTPSLPPNMAPSTTFSRAVMDPNVSGVCITIAIPRCRTRWGASPSTRSPASVTVPAEGRSRPPMVFSRVLLPAPLGPTTARISPSSTPNVTPSTAGRPPKRFSTASTASSAMLLLRLERFERLGHQQPLRIPVAGLVHAVRGWAAAEQVEGDPGIGQLSPLGPAHLERVAGDGERVLVEVLGDGGGIVAHLADRLGHHLDDPVAGQRVVLEEGAVAGGLQEAASQVLVLLALEVGAAEVGVTADGRVLCSLHHQGTRCVRAGDRNVEAEVRRLDGDRSRAGRMPGRHDHLRVEALQRAEVGGEVLLAHRGHFDLEPDVGGLCEGVLQRRLDRLPPGVVGDDGAHPLQPLALDVLQDRAGDHGRGGQ